MSEIKYPFNIGERAAMELLAEGYSQTLLSALTGHVRAYYIHDNGSEFVLLQALQDRTVFAGRTRPEGAFFKQVTLRGEYVREHCVEYLKPRNYRLLPADQALAKLQNIEPSPEP